MIIKLSDYILENTISDITISDIALEQAVAEVNVNMAICESCIRQMYQSIYMEDGESSDDNGGTSFIDKVKRFFISIGNWFRKMVIKFSGWLSEKRVNAVLNKLGKMTEEEKKNTTFVLPTEDVQERYTNMVNEMQNLCDTLKNLDKNTSFLTAEDLKKELQSYRTESKKKATNTGEIYKYDYDTYYEAIKKFRDAINEKKNALKTILNDIKKNPAEHFKIEDEKEAKKLYKVAKKYYDNFYTNITSSMTTLINCIKSAEKVLKKNPDSKDSIASGKRFREEPENIDNTKKPRSDKETTPESKVSPELVETINENEVFYSSAIRHFIDLINEINPPDFNESYNNMKDNLMLLLDKNSTDKDKLIDSARKAIDAIDSTFDNYYVKSFLKTCDGRVSKIKGLLELFNHNDVCYNITLAIVGLCYHKTNDESCFKMIGEPVYNNAKYRQAGDVCNKFRKCSGDDVIGAIKDWKNDPNYDKYILKKPVNDDSDTKKEETQSSTNTKANAILDALKDINSITNNDDVKKYFDEFVKSITEASDDKFNEVLNKSLQKLIFDVDNKLGITHFVKLINAIHKGTKYTDVFDWPLRGSTVTLEGKSVKEIANSTNMSVDDSKRYKVKHLSTPVMGYSDDGKDYIIQAKRATIELTDQEASSDNTGKKKTEEQPKTVKKDTKDEQQIPEDRLRRLEKALDETFKLTKPLGDKKYWKNFPELYDEYKEIYDRTIKCYQDMRGKLNTNEVSRYNDGYDDLRELAGKLSGDKTVKHSVHALQEIIDALKVSVINSHIYKRIPRQIYIVDEKQTYLVATCEDSEFNLCIKDIEEKNIWIANYYGKAEKLLKEQKDSADGSKKAE